MASLANLCDHHGLAHFFIPNGDPIDVFSGGQAVPHPFPDVDVQGALYHHLIVERAHTLSQDVEQFNVSTWAVTGISKWICGALELG